MIAEVHLHTPRGEAARREVEQVCRLLTFDNELWVQARGASKVPRCAKLGGIAYRPPVGDEKRTGLQRFLAAPHMFAAGYGSCCDIAPYDAAVLRQIYGVEATPVVPAQGPTSYHVNVLTPWGVYDPTFRWDDPAYVLPPLEWPKARRDAAIRRLCA